MTALAAKRNTRKKSITNIKSYPIADNVIIYQGSQVAIRGGYARPASTAVGDIIVGMALATFDNTVAGHALGALQVRVESGIFRWANGDTIVQADVGKEAYVVDDQTVSKASGGKSRAGMIVEVDSSGVWVETDGELATLILDELIKAPVRRARGVVFNNVADLTAFAVSGNAYDDGLTYVAGDRVLLANQTTAAQNGIYVVGTVATTAPLTRASDMPSAAVLPNGSIIEVSEGTVFKLTSWKSTSTTAGGAVIGTNDPAFYPRNYKQTVTLASGTYTIGFGSTATPDEPLFLLAGAVVTLSRDTHAGTLGTDDYEAPSASRVTGTPGTAVVVVNSINDNGGTGSSDSSTVDVLVTNW